MTGIQDQCDWQDKSKSTAWAITLRLLLWKIQEVKSYLRKLSRSCLQLRYGQSKCSNNYLWERPLYKFPVKQRGCAKSFTCSPVVFLLCCIYDTGSSRTGRVCLWSWLWTGSASAMLLCCRLEEWWVMWKQVGNTFDWVWCYFNIQ